MRKTSLVVLALLVITASLAFSEEESEVLGIWKGKFASPTYGIALWPGSVYGIDDGYEGDIMLPGVDLRIFMGTNVTKRAGFFFGTEIGTLFFLKPLKNSFADTWDEPTTIDYTVDMECIAGMVFALAKYGYRIDLGLALVGISLGAELGIGARVGNGFFEFKVDEGGAGWSVGMGTIDFMLDAALEGAVRIGKNLRFLVRLGAMLTPPLISEEGDGWGAWPGTDDDGLVTDTTEANALAGRYQLDLAPVILTGQLGFSLNY